jgi:DNA-binding response OmpR family regulator
MSVAAGKRILVVEDERDVVDLLTLNLQKTGEFQVSIAHDGATGLTKARMEKPALIILDLMLPKMSGLEVCKVLKQDTATRDIPVLMLTARAAEVDRVAGLEYGADDYVTKPFSPREVVLRVKAILRRGAADAAGEVFTSAGITIDLPRHRVSITGKPVRLTSIEFKLLQTLAQRRGRVQPRDRLLFDVWGYETMIDTRTVDTHVRRLREKLGAAGDIIETVRGFGYRFRDE